MGATLIINTGNKKFDKEPALNGIEKSYEKIWSENTGRLLNGYIHGEKLQNVRRNTNISGVQCCKWITMLCWCRSRFNRTVKVAPVQRYNKFIRTIKEEIK